MLTTATRFERITAEDNACSKKTKKAVTIKRKPGASPLLFGKYLMDHCAFVGLEDISPNLPSYREEVVPVTMDTDHLCPARRS